MDFIVHHELRGNVRELKNLIEREVILSEGGVLRRSDMPPQPSASGGAAELPSMVFILMHFLRKLSVRI